MSLLTPGLYRHYKGVVYRVICRARLESTGEDVIVYQSQDGEHDIWVRPLSEFMSTVDHQGRQVPRFAPLSEDHI